MIEIHVLGPVEVVRNGAGISPGGDKQRRLLALLALHAGRSVTADQLAEELWGEDAAPRPNALQVAVSRLRRDLGPTADIETVPGGYRLRCRVDAAEFQELARRGAQRLAAGDPRGAGSLLREALALWRGPALAGLDLGPLTGLAAGQLEEARLAAWEQRIEADLALGQDAGLVAELEGLVARHPLRERLRGHLMLALYRAGRQGDALTVFREGRRVSVEQLGLEPGPELQRLEQEMLRQDPRLELPPASAVARRTTESRLLEREAELAGVDEVLRGVTAGGGRGLVIEGVGGIGKTTLLSEVRARAEAAGMRVLAARGLELERDLVFGVVRQLFEAHLRALPHDERRALLSGAAERAEPLFGFASVRPAAERPREATDPAALLHGLYWLVASLSERGPLALLVDDLHWADQASLRFLTYLAQRLEDVHVLLAVAGRPAEPDVEESPIAPIAGAPATHVLHPALLGERAVADLVRQTLGARADDAFCRACGEATGGNPFLLCELLRAVVAEGVEPTAERIAHVQRMAPGSIARTVFPRLVRGGDEAVGLARAVAVLGGRGQLRHVAGLAELSEAAAAAAADRLVAAGVLRPGRPLDFAHPLLRSAVYEDMPAGARALAHRRAAQLLAAEGDPPERVAVHLLPAEPAGDPEVVSTLRAAALRAGQQGAPVEAVHLLRRAQAEPPVREVRGEVLAELGVAEFDAGQVEPAVEHLREALAEPLTAPVRVEATTALGMALATLDRLDETIALFEETIEELAAVDPDARMWMEVELQVAAGDHPPARRRLLPRRQPLLRELEGSGTLAELRLLALLADEAIKRNAPAAEVAELAQQTLADGRLLATAGGGSAVYLSAVTALTQADRLDAAAPHVREGLADAQRRGGIWGLAVAWSHRALHAHCRGDLLEAESSLRTAGAILEQHGLQQAAETLPPYLAVILAERGDLTGAEVTVGGMESESGGWRLMEGFSLMYRGHVRLLQGRHAEAATDLLAGGEWLMQVGYVGPAATPWRSDAALALSAQGERERAAALAAEEVELARAFGAPRPLGIALRAAGLIEGGDGGIELLRDAVAVLERSASRLEHARALIDLGAALRRARHRAEARDPLALGRELAHACGAEGLVERAGAELAATGARPRGIVRSGVEALTPSELRVARLAAEGRSNREIAQMLFVTRKTVESHLGSIYAKLGIRSRAELPDAIGPR